MRLLTFKVYTEGPAADLPVGQWQPGLAAVPEACLGHYLNGTLGRIGFDTDRPEALRTGLLVTEWHGHPRQALVVATGVGRLPGEPFAVSDQPADSAC
jgi:hypothetical protein